MKKDYKTATPQERLATSQKVRQQIISKYGFIPMSILPNMKNRKFDNRLIRDIIVEEEASYIEHNYNVRDGALSRFPTKIGVFAMKFWSNHGDKIWDPCIGRGQRAAIAYKLGRDYVGTDICEKFYNTVVGQFKKLGNRSKLMGTYEVLRDDPDYFHCNINGRSLEFILHDAKTVSLEPESVSLVMTSPPYWDIEFYDEHPEQLGIGKTYEEYLEGMEEIAMTAMCALKPGGFYILAINDFRKGGRLYMLHMDLFQTMFNVGFVPHDIVIYKIADHPLGAVFASQLEERKVCAKAHEFLIIGRKVGRKPNED